MMIKYFLCLVLCISSFMFADEIKFSKIGELPGGDKGDITLGDIDGDSDIDLIITGSNRVERFSDVYLNNGHGNFIKDENQSLIPLRYGDAILADLDNDNDLDLILQGQNSDNLGETIVYLNDGIGNFKRKRSRNLIGMYDSSIAVGDLNKDGFIDMVSCGKINAVSYESAIYFGDGSGAFVQVQEGALYDVNRGDLKLADMDNDKDLDLVIIGGSSDGRVGSIFTNLGDGNLSELDYDIIEPTIDGTLDLGDIDNNGFLDIIISGGKDGGRRYTALYFNNGDGSYELDDTSIIDLFSGDVKFGDVNNDGLLDLFVSGNTLNGNIVQFYLNSGDGFYDKIDVRGILNMYQSEIELIDINNDDKLDFIITGLDNSYKTKTIIYRNNN